MVNRRVRIRSAECFWLLVLAGLLWSTALAAQTGNCTGDPLSLETRAQIELTFDGTYTGSYRHGEPYDTVTIDPNGSGEKLEDLGIQLRVRLLCVPLGAPLDQGVPIVGVPTSEIVLFSTSLCMCAYKNPQGPTDDDGWTEFKGTIVGGGCSEGLELFVDGVFVTTIPLNVNSTDTGVISPCHTDASDLQELSTRLGNPALWSLCFDYNESGVIDAADVAYFASVLGAGCP